jgi:hypothetical protein
VPTRTGRRLLLAITSFLLGTAIGVIGLRGLRALRAAQAGAQDSAPEKQRPGA